MPTARPRPTPLRLVWSGPLGGRAGTTVPVGAGGLDAALAAVAPRVVVSVPGLGDAVLEPTSLADLRPSRAARSLPAVRALLDLARREAEGAGPDALAASGAPAPWVRRALAARREAEREGGSTAVDRLMQIAGPDEPARFTDEVEAEVGRIEAALARDPDFTGLEGAWRSLGWLARRLDLRGTVRLTAVSGDLTAEDAGDAGLQDALDGAGLLAVDAEIGPSARDVERAGRLAALGASAGVPVVASAAPALVGAASASAPVPPVRHDADPRFAAWTGLRDRPEARWLALAYPPVRLVPGRDLWGGGALAVAADAADAHARGAGVPGLGCAPVRDTDADSLAFALPREVADDVATAGVCALVLDGGGARVARAPSVAATSGSGPRAAALSLPAALFAARVAAVAAAPAEAVRSGLERELAPWARVEPVDGGLRVVLPAEASPTLRADVALTLTASAA